ncbi:hypothetical protein C9374_011743 [Naegleria lovaniensis]|uniref:Rab-GAP TBC domain-containing protein n=1 Tax=Naegleria lovaniensis TaxID=51637 RepID=A0AA88GFD0_NAELO|nr:uncharacterized protein C9374_011743 [Naegleria lovaniensis]KAG2373858.1 hypothetical protein C9374_011743 [Naegleria lovaniensis]
MSASTTAAQHNHDNNQNPEILAGYRDEREPCPVVPLRYSSLNISIEEKARIIQQMLKSEHTYWIFKRKVKAEIAKSKYSLDDVRNNLFQYLPSTSLPPSFAPTKTKNDRNIIQQILEQEEWDVSLDNEVFRFNLEAERNTRLRQKYTDSEGTEEEDTGLVIPPLPYEEEKLLIVQEAQAKGASESSTSNISEILDELTGMKITTKKPDENSEPEGPLISSLSVKPRYTGLFDSKKMMEMCISISNSNASEMLMSAGWGQIKLEVKTPSTKELQVMFQDLDPENCQIGLDDFIDEKFEMDYLEKTKRSQKNIRMAYEIAKRGVPTSLRASIWGKILEVEMDEKHKEYFELLRKDVRKREFLIDHMVHNDVKRTMDDENYFVFEDVADEMMIIFSRDPYVANNMEHPPKFIVGLDDAGISQNEEVYPPSGVIPFEGLSMLAAPVCYLSNDTMEVYFLWRNLYTRLFCKLHTISSKSEGLISLCRLFEDLLQDKDPQLFYHLLQLKIQPLEIAFNWIFHAFAGYLAVDQLLLLWDRILGFSNLYILPILAVSIFLFRSKYLLKVTSKQEILDIFSDFTVVQVIPLLQMFLFS